MGLWRQVPEIAGGGFLFDTGAHMLNTITDLLGENFVELAARLDNRGTPVDILGSIMTRTVSGVLVTMNGCGEAIETSSDIHIFCSKAIIQTDVWGKFLELQRNGEETLTPVDTPPSLGQWDQFLRVRRGEMSNPSPPPRKWLGPMLVASVYSSPSSVNLPSAIRFATLPTTQPKYG